MPSTKTLGRDVGTKLCKIFGFDPDRVREISVAMTADDVSMVTVKVFVYEDEAEQVVDMLEEYQLVPRVPEGA